MLSTVTGERLGVLALHGIDVPVNIDSICENFRSRKCVVLLFYIMIDAISSLSHAHLFFCDKEGMMIWECKHAE